MSEQEKEKYQSRAYDYFSPFKKRSYNPDGTVTESRRQYLLSQGVAPSKIEQFEEGMKKKIKEFDDKEKRYLEIYGMTYSQKIEESGGFVPTIE